MPLKRSRKMVDIIHDSDSGLREIGENLARAKNKSARHERVPIGDLRPDPNNARDLRITLDMLREPDAVSDTALREELDHIRNLSETIKDGGLLQPVSAYVTPGGVLQLIMGERRWWACQLAGMNQIDAFIYPERPPDIAVKALTENIHRRNLSLAGVLRGLRQVMEQRQAGGAPITTGDHLSEVVRLPRSVAYRWWRVLGGPQDVQDAVLNGTIPTLVVANDLCVLTASERRARIGAQDFELAPRGRATPKPAKRGKGGRPATKVNMGATRDGRVVREIIQNVDTGMELGDVDWNDLQQVGAAWRTFLLRLTERVQRGMP